ncbi:hypothetical protein ACLKA7_015767 [Drosophila subpalustris]
MQDARLSNPHHFCPPLSRVQTVDTCALTYTAQPLAEDAQEQEKETWRPGDMDRLTASSFLAFAAKQTQIKTFDVNLLAEAEELHTKMGGVRKI